VADVARAPAAKLANGRKHEPPMSEQNVDEDDGDPTSSLPWSATGCMTQVPVVPGAVIRCRPIGVLCMTDEHGGDEKIIAVPTEALHPFFNNVKTCEDLPQILRDQIRHFFQHYEDLESGKWVRVVRWGGPARTDDR
jgi:inorganic pyrophosphatase